MRNISFALTTEQVRNQTKDVTRRLGWLRLKPGDVLQPVIKNMGLGAGEKIEKIATPVTVVATRQEPLRRMTDEQEYGRRECQREGFPHLTPAEFITMFCATHRGCTPETIITRIQISYRASISAPEQAQHKGKKATVHPLDTREWNQTPTPTTLGLETTHGNSPKGETP